MNNQNLLKYIYNIIYFLFYITLHMINLLQVYFKTLHHNE